MTIRISLLQQTFTKGNILKLFERTTLILALHINQSLILTEFAPFFCMESNRALSATPLFYSSASISLETMSKSSLG